MNPTVDEMNRTQRAWCDLRPSDAATPAGERILSEMSRHPRCYVAIHEGRGAVCICHGAPTSDFGGLADALATLRAATRREPAREDVCWWTDGENAEWRPMPLVAA